MPADKMQVLLATVQQLQGVTNVVAVVLGGSYALGTARPGSDIDVGIYYREALPLPVEQIRAISQRLCTPGTNPVVTEAYGWGLWVNGGAWIQTPAGKVDLLYRNLDQVERVIDEGCRGVWHHDFDQQPPFGFRSVIYFGETSICMPLFDPEGEIARVKKLVATYPERLKNRIIQESLWNAEFSLRICQVFASSGDVYNSAGCVTRVAQFLVHALFALNEVYFVSDKYATELVEEFALAPFEFTARLAQVLSRPGSTANELHMSLDLLAELWHETVALTNAQYQPRYDLKTSLPEIEN
jgi:hypothetical protein